MFFKTFPTDGAHTVLRIARTFENVQLESYLVWLCATIPLTHRASCYFCSNQPVTCRQCCQINDFISSRIKYHFIWQFSLWFTKSNVIDVRKRKKRSKRMYRTKPIRFDLYIRSFFNLPFGFLFDLISLFSTVGRSWKTLE